MNRAVLDVLSIYVIGTNSNPNFHSTLRRRSVCITMKVLDSKNNILLYFLITVAQHTHINRQGFIQGGGGGALGFPPPPKI